MAQVVRRGFEVLFFDTDIVVLRDIWQWLLPAMRAADRGVTRPAYSNAPAHSQMQSVFKVHCRRLLLLPLLQFHLKRSDGAQRPKEPSSHLQRRSIFCVGSSPPCPQLGPALQVPANPSRPARGRHPRRRAPGWPGGPPPALGCK